jgi:hypothetical protein
MQRVPWRRFRVRLSRSTRRCIGLPARRAPPKACKPRPRSGICRRSRRKLVQVYKLPRGRRLANGSLYLVTGSEKASAWGMASFYSVRDEFQLTFTPDSTHQYRWRGNPAEKKSYNPSPINDGPLDQTTFIHGLSITLGTGIWGRLFGTVEIREIVESRSASAGESSTPAVRRTSPRRQSSLLSWAHSFFRGGAEAGERQYVGENGRVILSDLSPISKARYLQTEP